MTSSSSRKKFSVWVDLEDIQKEDDIPGIAHGWFTETEEAALWPGQRFSLALEVRLPVVALLLVPYSAGVIFCSTNEYNG